MIGRLPAIRQLPTVVPHPIDGIWEVIVPVARTNLVTNPSFETGTTSWTAIGGSIARSTTRQYHGAYSLAITPTAATTDGARFDTVSLVSGTLYAYSAKVWAEYNAPIKLAIETTGGVELSSVTARGLGRWQWLYGYYLETSTTTRRVTLRKNGGTDTRVIYLDGVQVEAIAAGETVSTYLDGDQLGFVPNQVPPAYYWNGTPHASTSTRSGLTRAGGMVVRFKDYGFFLAAIVGLGLALPQNVATEYARIDGGFADYTRKPTRQFSIVGQFEARNYLELRQMRGGLARLLDRDQNAQDQQLLLRYHLENGCGDVQSDVIAISCKYQGGLDGQMDNHFAQATPITFTQYLPMIGSDGESGSALSVQQSVADMDYVAERLANGTWRNISSSFNNSVLALLYTSNNQLIIAGDFTAPQTRVASWDGTTLSAMGAGLAAGVQSLVESPDGTVYAGLSTAVTIGGVNGSVVRFTGGAWAVVGATGTMVNSASQMIFARDGSLYVAGNNTIGRATLDKWNGTAWSNIITHSASSTFFAVVEAPTGLYVAGSFTNLNADANQDNIAFYNLTSTTWSALGTGLNSQVSGQGLAIGLNGLLYVIGTFTTAGGVTAAGAAIWNGVSWSAMGAGLTNQTLQGDAQVMPDGSIIMGGSFTGSNGVAFPDPLARWNGSTFVPLDADLPADASTPILSLATSIDGKIAAGYNSGGISNITAATTTVTNSGTARSYPTLIIRGPSSGTARVYQCVNITTGRAIYLNYTINAGETARLVLQPDNISFISDFQGNIANTILPGSQVADFFLQPGANVISFFSASSTVTATLHWRPNYASLDDVP